MLKTTNDAVFIMLKLGRNMRILYITNQDDKYGGAQCLMELMDQMLNYPNIQITCLNSANNQLNTWCDKRNIENFSFPYTGQMYSKHDKGCKFLIKYILHFLKYTFVNPRIIQKIEKKIDISSYDIIHTNTSTIDIGAKLANKYDIKHVWHLREFGQEDMNFIPHQKNCYDQMAKTGGEFIAVSDAVKEAWIKKGIPEHKISRIYDGVRADAFKQTSCPFTGKILKIILCGSITKFKGQDQLINAFSLMPIDYRNQFRIDFWGTGTESYVTKLKEKIKALDLSNTIRFMGYCPNIHNILPDYDIGMTCSCCEAFGRVTAEYMMAGLLVVASNTGANAELIDDGHTGLLYDRNNPIELTQKLMSVADNRGNYIDIAMEGKIHAKKYYSIETNSANFYNKYNSLLSP